MDEGHEMQQYSQTSREGLHRATAELIEGLKTHSQALSNMHGGAAEMQELFAQNATIESLIQTWNDAVFEHTGTAAVLLDDFEDPDLDLDLDFDEDDDAEPTGDALSIVTRVDLTIEDPDALLAAGRAAHLRLWPNELAEDAEVAVTTPAQALYTIAHEAGESWLDLPGTNLDRAARAYVVPEDDAEVDDELSQDVALPPGTLVISESWH